MNNSFDIKSEARALLAHAAKLLTGQHRGENLPEVASFTFWPLFLAYLLIASMSRIVGHADAGPITALTAPIAWAAVLYFVGVLRRGNVLTAFMVISIAIDIALIFIWAVQLNHIMVQWAFALYRMGAIGYFMYKMSPPDLLPEPLVEEAQVEAPKDTSWKRNQYSSVVQATPPSAKPTELES